MDDVNDTATLRYMRRLWESSQAALSIGMFLQWVALCAEFKRIGDLFFDVGYEYGYTDASDDMENRARDHR